MLYVGCIKKKHLFNIWKTKNPIVFEVHYAVLFSPQ